MIKFTDQNNRVVAILDEDDQEPTFLDKKELEEKKDEEDATE